MNPERRVEILVFALVGVLLTTAFVLMIKRYWGIASICLTTAGAIVDQLL